MKGEMSNDRLLFATGKLKELHQGPLIYISLT